MLRNYIVSLKSKYILLYILSILIFFLFLYESDSKIGFISYIGNNYLPLVTCSIFFSFILKDQRKQTCNSNLMHRVS